MKSMLLSVITVSLDFSEEARTNAVFCVETSFNVEIQEFRVHTLIFMNL